MRVDEFDFALDEALIAEQPPEARDGARMMVLGEPPEHDLVQRLPERLPEGAVLVLNDTRVIPARLFGVRESGGKIELLLTVREAMSADDREQRWQALGRASKPLRPGTMLSFGDGALGAEVLAKHDSVLTLRLFCTSSVSAMLDRLGKMPVPPYIAKRRQHEADALDRERYQTVFGDKPGAIAAPTAGLHLSEAMLTQIRARGIEIVKVTLHVGLGTFQPVTVDDLDQHPMHEERYEISAHTAEVIAAAKAAGRPVVAVGTTVVRALESAALGDGRVRQGPATTSLLIQPGYRFQVVTALLTNFHLPKSTLLALVCAFGGQGPVMRAYELATRERYRFFSYGDCMYLRTTEPPSTAPKPTARPGEPA